MKWKLSALPTPQVIASADPTIHSSYLLKNNYPAQPLLTTLLLSFGSS